MHPDVMNAQVVQHAFSRFTLRTYQRSRWESSGPQEGRCTAPIRPGRIVELVGDEIPSLFRGPGGFLGAVGGDARGVIRNS